MDDDIFTPAAELMTLVSPEWIYRHQVVPLKKSGSTLYLGMRDPSDQNIINAIMFHTGLKIHPQLISQAQWQQFLDAHCQTATAVPPAVPDTVAEERTRHFVEETHTSYHDPIVQFVNQLIRDALLKLASDIHIEPFETHCRIRFRQDGILYKITEINHSLALRLITRLKVMTQLDISERRLPQDGRLLWRQDQQKIDIRINTCPTIHGEKVVLRILDTLKSALALDNLGLLAEQKEIFLNSLATPQGLILVAGPTGSGKTVTLYTALQFLNDLGKNISTIEDPVEIQLDGINQVNINPKIGLTFATLLRSILRQDPDVIMVGEIRDAETAEIAIQAALTGHLVLSTIHTNNSFTTLSRLSAMGIAPYHLANSISLIIAQRLVRKLCLHCRQMDSLADPAVFRAGKCALCLQGYKGRTGIYELLPMTQTLAAAISSGSSTPNPEFLSLASAGMYRVIEGITSMNEIHRVLRI